MEIKAGVMDAVGAIAGIHNLLRAEAVFSYTFFCLCLVFSVVFWWIVNMRLWLDGVVEMPMALVEDMF
jgi:hypothetical protein